ncbi:MAG: peptidoglycan DL-endopeptidase CwlO [Actinomycetota bacterium]|nr:peptidoglycan DL-endopeptidase CwlO [Actinomycetota bacterium]
MSIRRRPGGAAAAAIVPAALILALLAPGSATAAPGAHAPDYPTWADVQNAKRNQAATEAEINRIEGLLVALENQAVQLGKVAQLKAEQYAQARDALAAATQKVQRLSDRADQAQARADESAARAAHLIAQLARTGGGDLTLGLLIGSASDTDQLLSRLGTMNRLTESSTDILTRARFDQKLALSLTDDAKVAEKIRSGLADDAQTALAAAQAASDKAEAQVAAQEKHANQMYAQLATLKNTTAEVEKNYQEGLTEQQEQEQNNPPAPPVSTPPSGVDPTPDPPVGSSVSQAIAYAKAQLGEAYGFGGAGPSRWDCSGLTKMSYASAGVYIGTHSVNNQYQTMKAQGRLVPVGAIKAGDLLFYSGGGSTANGSMYHVTLYVGGGQMIEAPRPGVSVRIVSVRYGDLVPYAGRPTG